MRSPFPRLDPSLFWLAGGVIFAALSLLAARWQPGGQHDDRLTRDIQVRFRELDARLGILLRDTALLGDLATGCEEAPDTGPLRETPFGLYLYQEGNLRWWNNNHVLPDAALSRQLALQPDGRSDPRSGPMLRLANGFYVVRQMTWGDFQAIGLIPIRYEYAVQNRYLRPHFLPELGIPDQTLLLGSDMLGNTIHDSRNQPVFSLHFTPQLPAGRKGALITGLLSFVLLLIALLLGVRQRMDAGHKVQGTALLGAVLFLLRVVLSNSNWPPGLRSQPLFDPHFYASPGIASSLGILLADALLLLVFGLFLLRYFRLASLLSRLPLPSWLSASLPLLALLLLFRVGVNVLYSLVADSNISFDLDNFLRLDGFSFAGLLAVALLLANLLVYGRWFVACWTNWNERSIKKQLTFPWLPLLLAMSFYAVFILMSGNSDTPFIWHHLISALLFAAIAWWFSRKEGAERSLPGLLVWTAFFALFSASLLLRTDRQREQDMLQRYALRLASDQDPVMEYLFSDVAQSVRQDPFVRNLFADAYPALRPAEEHIMQVYLGEYFDRYRVQINFYNAANEAIGNPYAPSRAHLDSLLLERGEATASEGLYHLRETGRVAYIARVPVGIADSRSGTVYLQLEAKLRSGASLYPELLMRDPGFENPEGYDHAVYRNEALVSQEGDFPYPLRAPENWIQGQEFVWLAEGGHQHLIHRTRENKLVVITRASTAWTVPLSMFSYLFLFFLLVAALASVPVLLASASWRLSLRPFGGNLSLRGRIQSFVVLLTLLSFLIIGAITISYFNRQSQDYHRSRLLRKLEAVATEIEYESAAAEGEGESERSRDRLFPYERGLQADLSALSNIHKIDLNLYDTLGQLLRSSQPDIFTQGLQSKVMEPEAWAVMQREQRSHWVQTEQIGSLPYLSAYRPLQAADGRTAAFLHMPYFAKEKNQRQEVSGFMVALVNVYVLLLVAAGLVALGISNSVTRSLATISAQFQKVKVGERNEPITWKSRDEIGLLVSEYNKMLAQLERSAALLARSERESAWREMARQVAHEIKNPLTPMRLSIQHLQRAIAAGDPRAEELTGRVSRTLLEQIETLSHIATEFSNFAQMPTPRPEQVNPLQVLQSVVALYEVETAAALSLHAPDEPISVWADKDQLQRVFSNLVKNAFQAIPDDREGRIRVELSASPEQVFIRVIDNGSGIAPDQYQRVFVPNFTTKSSGMGLGLAMCKNIVEYAGGRIEFVSQLDRGTTFTVTLPRYRAGEGSTPSEA